MTEPPDTDGPDIEEAPPEPTFNLTPGRFQFDAPQADKIDWDTGAGSLPADEPAPAQEPDDPSAPPAPRPRPEESPRILNFVLPPPVSAATASGSRAPRRAADVAGADAGARHNWIPSGPRNVGGRVTSLVVDPTDPLTMYAGAAAGGVYRTRDAGETWVPLWQDLPSLAVGAIGLCRAHPRTIYVGTGENRTGGGEAIPGNGVYRSKDGGDTWENLNTAVPPVPGAAPNQAFSFEAIAVHPTTEDHCWAVGRSGIFRTTDGGRNWVTFEPGIHYSDVVFSQSAAGQPILYLVRGSSRTGAFVIRLDDPVGADQAAISAAANRSRVVKPPDVAATQQGVLTPAPDHPARGKIAICASRPDVAYVRFTREGGGDFGVFRTRNARADHMNETTWRLLRRSLDWPIEGQGDYNLSIAVDPNDPNNVVTGMVELYLSRNANTALPDDVRWLRAQAWELYAIDRAHHADNHAALFAPVPGAAAGAPQAIWVANDGGIARCLDWPTGAGYPGQREQPLGVDTAPTMRHDFTVPFRGVDGNNQPVAQAPMTWRKRSHGITAGQMYDLTQSPLVPSLYGCGFQDNGVYATSGSETWRFVLGADGGFVAFDPDDPYRFLATWQGGIAEVDFPGQLAGTFPAPGDALLDDLWPRELRLGFDDDAAFVADTAHHPRKSGRILHARMNRLYGSTARGERWQPEQVGAGLELRYVGTANFPRLEVLPSQAAQTLGFVPQVSGRGIQSMLLEPFRLVDGDVLHMVVDGRAVDVTFHAGAAIPTLATASAAQIAAYLRANIAPAPLGQANITAQPYFPPSGLTVEITTRDVGAARTIAIGGSALTPPAAPANSLPRLGLLAGTYRGGPNRPASVTLAFPGFTRESFVRNRDLTGLELTVQVNGGTVRHIPFAAPAFPDPAWVRTGELVAAIAGAAAADPVDVVSSSNFKSVRLTALTNRGFRVSGTAANRLNMPAGNPQQANTHWVTLDARLFFFRDDVFGQNVGNHNSFDLTSTGAPLRLVINDNGGRTATIIFDGTVGAANLRCVTSEELQRIIAGAITPLPDATRPRVACDLVVFPDEGKPTAIRYAESDPDVVWVAGENGYLVVSKNDGGSWTSVGDPRFRLRDRSVEAIAIDPRDSKVVLVGLAGRTTTRGDDSGFLFRTRDDGAHWDHVGGDLKDSLGAFVGVNALEIDTAAPDTVFAATDVGVFRSTDGGTHWSPFNEGLPNVLVRDLAFVPATRTLRAGAWGRGVYERHVGDRAPKDVQLFVRASGLDDGSVRPAPEGPDVFATTPRTAGADSPDIKVNRVRPPGIGTDDLVDGVEFDEDITHEQPVTGASHVFVQVHNRGAFPATDVRVVAVWADASSGPPPLPPDFWTRLAAGHLEPSLGAWKLLGEAVSLTVAPGYPRVHTFDFDWPDAIDAMARIGILLLVTGAEDVLQSTALTVSELLAAEPKIAYRETAVCRKREDAAFFLQQTGPVQFTLANPAAGTSAVAALGIDAAVLGTPQSEVTGGSEPFNLGPGPQALDVTTPPQAITVAFVQGPIDIPQINVATPAQISAFLNRAFRLAGIPARADFRPVVQPAPDFFAFQFLLRGTGGATLVVGAPPPGITDAGPVLNFVPAAAATQVLGDVLADGDTYDLTGASLQLTATNTATISLQATDFADITHATAREVRIALNRGLGAAQLPVQAIVPKVDLRIRRSAADADGAPAVLAGHRLADLVAHLAAGGTPAEIFDLTAKLRDAQVTKNVDHHLFLRTSNLGTARQREARHRVYELAFAADGIHPNPIGGPVLQPVPAGGSAVVDFTWHPDAAAPERLFVLAVVDVDADGRRLDPPPSFATVEELDAFCDAHPNTAYREFAVVT